jgi:hypothetical protein
MDAKKKGFVANTKAPAGSYAVTKKVGGKTIKSYPTDTIARARNALSRVGQHGTAADKGKVYAKVKSEYPALAKRSTVIKTPKPKGKGRK